MRNFNKRTSSYASFINDSYIFRSIRAPIKWREVCHKVSFAVVILSSVILLSAMLINYETVQYSHAYLQEIYSKNSSYTLLPLIAQKTVKKDAQLEGSSLPRKAEKNKMHRQTKLKAERGKRELVLRGSETQQQDRFSIQSTIF